MPDPSGKTVVKEIGGFRLIRQLGEGGMGKVFLAQQQSLSRRVALKVLPPEMAGDQEFLARFHREAQSAAMFQHHNVVNVFSAGRDPRCGVHYIAFELVEGGSLEDLLKEQPKLPEERALFIARGIAQALAYAESKDLVHRDVKPDNILLDTEGNPKLADLGLAKQPRLETVQVTQTGMVLGTPLYMAPEQALGVSDLDIRADIYALGLCLWRMLTGLMPFDESNSNSSLQILTKHINEDLIDARERAPNVSEGAAKITAWMAARERDDRYQSAKSLARDLDLVLTGEEPLGPESPATASGLGETVAMPSAALRAASSRRNRVAASGRKPKERDRLPLPLIAGVLVGALGIGIGLAVAFSDAGPAEPTTAKVEPTKAAAKTVKAVAPQPNPTLAPTAVAPAPPLRKTEPPVDHAVDPPPPPPPTIEPTPAATTAPKPPPAKTDSSPAAEALDRFRTVFFAATHEVEQPQRALLQAIQDLPQRPRIERSLQLARAILHGSNDRKAIARKIDRNRQSDIDDPLPGALGTSFTDWLLELKRLNTLLSAVEAHLRDPSAARDLKLNKTLMARLDRKAKAAFEKMRKRRDRKGEGRGFPRRPPPPRMQGRMQERMHARIRGQANKLLDTLRTPESRLKGHAQFVALLVYVVNGVDRWDELNFFQKVGVGLVHGLAIQHRDIRRTAIALALRRPLDELGAVSQLLAKKRPAPRAWAEVYLRRADKATDYLKTRVRPATGGDRAALGVLVIAPRVGGKKKRRLDVTFGRHEVSVRMGSIRVKGKSKVKFERLKKDAQLFLRPHSDDQVEVTVLNSMNAPMSVYLAGLYDTDAKVKIKGEARRTLVIPRIGPPPGNTGLRNLLGGGRRGGRPPR